MTRELPIKPVTARNARNTIAGIMVCVVSYCSSAKYRRRSSPETGKLVVLLLYVALVISESAMEMGAIVRSIHNPVIADTTRARGKDGIMMEDSEAASILLCSTY